MSSPIFRLSALEDEAARALGVDRSSFVRGELALRDGVVAISSHVDAGAAARVDVPVPHEHGREPTFGVGVLTCCFAVAGGVSVELDTLAVSPQAGPIAARCLAHALLTQGASNTLVVPDWDLLIREPSVDPSPAQPRAGGGGLPREASREATPGP